MSRKQIGIFLLIIGIAFSFYTYEKNLREQIAERQYELDMFANCNLALEINRLLLKRDWRKDINQFEIITNLNENLYDHSRALSDYEIQNEDYLDKFQEFNYFQDYSYQVKRIIFDHKITKNEIDILERYQEELKQKKLDLIFEYKVIEG